jgi:hypothetical protein
VPIGLGVKLPFPAIPDETVRSVLGLVALVALPVLLYLGMRSRRTSGSSAARAA